MKRAGLLLLALYACGDEDDRGLVHVRLSGVFEPASLEFGDVPVNGSKSLRATLVNTGELTLADLLPSISDDRFSLSMEEPVPPGGQGAATVSFTPAGAGEANAALALVSGGGERIELAAHGNGALAPIFASDPPSIDFGVVELGTEAIRTLAIDNRGSAPGWIGSVEVAPPFAVANAGPFALEEGSRIDLEVAFRPESAGEHATPLMLATNALDPVLSIALIGRVQIGALACTPDPLDFGGIVRGGSGALNLRCVSTGSIRYTGAELSGSDLFSIDAPEPIDLGLDAVISVSVVFTAAGPQADHQGTISLRYLNAEGDRTTEVPLSARVLAPEPAANAISIFLFWDTELTDMDLHLVAPGGAPFASDGSDCNFQRPTADWGTEGDASDDPFLDRDDFDGIGPENINLSNAVPGSYEVYVHYYADNRVGASTANVEVHGGGTTLGVFDRSLTCDDLWHAGTIVWDGARASFVPSFEVSPSGRGICF